MASQKPNKPNILFLLSDQHRAQSMGCYGNQDIHTPHMDRLAQEGIRFTNCMSGAPLCCPFRATLQTGLYHHQHGALGGPSPNLKQFKGMGQYLSEAGYETCYIGKTHWSNATPPGFVPVDERMGWKQWKGTSTHRHYSSQLFDNDGRINKVSQEFEGQYEPPLETDWAMEFIQQHEQQRDQEKPWAVQLNWGPPHSCYGIEDYDSPEIWKRLGDLNRKYEFNLPEEWFRSDAGRIPQIIFPQHLIARIVPQEFLDQYDRDELALEPNVEERWQKLARYYYQEYYAMITSIDHEMGRLLDFLEESGQMKNTIVIYTSDHGDKLCSFDTPRGKNSLYQGALRVPLLVWGPEADIRQGEVSDVLVNSVDLLPTVLELAGIDQIPELPGQSASDWIVKSNKEKKGKENRRERQQDIFLGLWNWRGVYDGRFLYGIEVPEGESGAEENWKPIHLIDTQADPYDLNDLLKNPGSDPENIKKIQNRLHGRLLYYLEKENDVEFLTPSLMI